MKNWRLLSLFIGVLGLGILQAQSTDSLDIIMDNWHHAAAVADADAFFGRMAEEGIYIGTDASERWLRDELREWSQAAFEREVAWKFEAFDRNWHFLSPDIVVGDEKLNTWMGVCRSTMVLKRVNGQWLIYHYQLSVTVPNEQIKAFKELMEAE